MSRFVSSSFRSWLACAGLFAALFGFAQGAAFAQTRTAELDRIQAPPQALPAAEQRVALVIGNSKYQNTEPLANPDNDAQSVAELLNAAGFEVIAATDLSQNDMIKVVQDFSAKIAERGPDTVAMVYYAGHGVQVAGENYLIPVDAKITSPTDLVNNSLRLVDVMATLESIPSRLRIVMLDSCRTNPFPNIVDDGRGLAIVDAPLHSIVGYSTSPGEEALDGGDGHSPYTQAFLHPRAPAEPAHRATVQAHPSPRQLRNPAACRRRGRARRQPATSLSSAIPRLPRAGRPKMARWCRWPPTCPGDRWIRSMTTCCPRALRPITRSSSTASPTIRWRSVSPFAARSERGRGVAQRRACQLPGSLQELHRALCREPLRQAAVRLQSQPRERRCCRPAICSRAMPAFASCSYRRGRSHDPVRARQNLPGNGSGDPARQQQLEHHEIEHRDVSIARASITTPDITSSGTTRSSRMNISNAGRPPSTTSPTPRPTWAACAEAADALMGGGSGMHMMGGGGGGFGRRH